MLLGAQSAREDALDIRPMHDDTPLVCRRPLGGEHHVDTTPDRAGASPVVVPPVAPSGGPAGCLPGGDSGRVR